MQGLGRPGKIKSARKYAKALKFSHQTRLLGRKIYKNLQKLTKINKK